MVDDNEQDIVEGGFCEDCKWSTGYALRSFCLNPINDKLYNLFNASTGNTVMGLRQSIEIDLTERQSCHEPRNP